MWPYIAGFFDGEGSIYWSYSDGSVMVPVATMCQSSKHAGGLDALHKIRSFLLANGIRCSVQIRDLRYRCLDNPRWGKKNYVMGKLTINSRRGVTAFLHGIAPYSIVRRLDVQDFSRLLKLYPSLLGYSLCRKGRWAGHVKKTKPASHLTPL